MNGPHQAGQVTAHALIKKHEPMICFIDCEFTNLEAPELLSIGLVAADGREFYLELAGKSHFADASTFVLDTVVPQFGLMPNAVNTQKELGKRVGTWLLDLADHGKLSIAYDYQTDFDLLERALRSAGLWARLKDVIIPTHIGYLIDQDDVVEAMEASWFESYAANGIERHHALADARALRCGYQAVHCAGVYGTGSPT